MEKLYDLIHSLTQSEKRFVKIRLNGNKASSILNIYFDVLSKQKQYVFDDLLLAGKQSKKLTQSNLSLLFEVILKHLQSHYASTKTDYQLRGDLNNVRILKDKGFIVEAKSHCKKLIQKSAHKEDFEILKSAYKDYWNLHLFNGELNDESNQEIQAELVDVLNKENEIFDLEQIYRSVTTLYYNYFFKKRDAAYPKQIKAITSKIGKAEFLSDKAQHIFYEIKAIEHIIHSDLEQHHEIRKKQLKLLIQSPVFEKDHLSRLMVLSNVFTLLKSKNWVTELSSYLDFMETYFQPVLENYPDSVFMEKYYDIYFLNQSYLQVWLPNEDKLDSLLKRFKMVISKGYLANPLLVGRTYLGIIELQIINGNYKATTPLLTEFFNLSKKKKYSKHYIEGDLLFLVEKYLQEKLDVFDNALEALNRKITRNEIDLDNDQKILLKFLNDLFNGTANSVDVYVSEIKIKQTYKLLIYKMLGTTSIVEIRAQKFPVQDKEYNPLKDSYLADIYRF